MCAHSLSVVRQWRAGTRDDKTTIRPQCDQQCNSSRAGTAIGGPTVAQRGDRIASRRRYARIVLSMEVLVGALHNGSIKARECVPTDSATRKA